MQEDWSFGNTMKPERTIGLLFILGAVGVFVPYTMLTMIFDYPDILRQDAGVILSKFHDGGSRLIWTWWAFAVLGLPLLAAYVLLGQKLESRLSFVRLGTTVGLIGLVVQMVGLLRWTFVVPILANDYVTGNTMTREASQVAFQVVHQYGGVVLGEHIGQLFTIVWTFLMSLAFAKLKLLPTWVSLLGYGASTIYLLAQAELFATVIPGFPVWDLAGFLGSSLWLVWLIATGILLMAGKTNL